MAATVIEALRRFLPAVLKSVEAERDEACRIVGVPYAEHATLLTKLVVVERVRRQHDASPDVLGEPRI